MILVHEKAQVGHVLCLRCCPLAVCSSVAAMVKCAAFQAATSVVTTNTVISEHARDEQALWPELKVL